MAVLLAIGAETAIWAVACWRLEDGYRQTMLAAASQGVETQGTLGRWSGWPFAAEIAVDRPGMRGAPGIFPPGLAWNAERLRIRLSAWHPTWLQVLPEGAETIVAAGLPPVPFEAAALRILVDLTGRDPVRAVTREMDVTLPSGRAHVAGGMVKLPADGIDATLDGLALPGIAVPIASLRVLVSVEPPLSPAATAAASAQAWRGAGGTLSIQAAHVQWDRLDAVLTGSGGLDAALQPEGSGTMVVTGLAEFLDRLVTLGAVPPSSGTAAKAVVALLAAPGGGGKLSLPVALNGGVLSIARFPLLRLAPVAWN